MATTVNAPITVTFVAAAGNTGNVYDYVLNTTINSWRTDWALAATPIHLALTTRTYPAVHWAVMVSDEGYSTPPGLYPYNRNRRVKLSNFCGSVEIGQGRQFFANLVTADLANAETLATPVF